MKFIVCDHVSLSVICTSRNQSLSLSRMTHSLYYKNMFHKNDETVTLENMIMCLQL